MYSEHRPDIKWAGNRIKGTSVGRRTSSPFGVRHVRPATPPPEANPWWWNPSRAGVLGPPAHFAAELKTFDPSGDLAVTWNAFEERWYVWYRKPRLRSKLCSGWALLFPVRYSGTNEYMPLDGRVFARLFQASSAKWGNGLHYFERIVAEQERDRERADKRHNEDRDWKSRDFYQHLQPSVGYGASNGSKVSNNL